MRHIWDSGRNRTRRWGGSGAVTEGALGLGADCPEEPGRTQLGASTLKASGGGRTTGQKQKPVVSPGGAGS